MRVLFMGTPEYAVPVLQAVCRCGARVRVVTRPDAPRGRGRRLLPSPVAAWAAAQGLDIDKPAGPLAEFRAAWQAFAPDVVWTAAYGRILPGWLLALPRHGPYNLHASLLPRWRGANPIRWAIRAGDRETGVSLMRMEAGLDTGPVVDQVRVPLEPETDAGTLTARLAQAAAELTGRWLPVIAAGQPIPLIPQAALGSEPSYADKWGPEMEHLDWEQPAEVLARWVWSLAPQPGAYAWLSADGSGGRRRVKILAARPAPPGLALAVGALRWEGERWLVGCGGQTVLEISAIQPEGRGRMTPGAFSRGARLGPNARLT